MGGIPGINAERGMGKASDAGTQGLRDDSIADFGLRNADLKADGNEGGGNDCGPPSAGKIAARRRRCRCLDCGQVRIDKEYV